MHFNYLILNPLFYLREAFGCSRKKIGFEVLILALSLNSSDFTLDTYLRFSLGFEIHFSLDFYGAQIKN